MRWLGAATFLILAAIALLHLAWGFGVRWPATNERDLVALVIGANGRSRMPSALSCGVAALAIFGAGGVALLLGGWISAPRHLVSLLGVVTLLVFALRGALAYLPAWRSMFSQQPFARYDQIFYGPLCVAIACALAILLFDRLKA